jgi:ComF family protein
MEAADARGPLALLGAALRDLLFPPACLGCGRSLARQALFCPGCAAQVELVEPLGQGACREAPPPFALAWAAAAHQGPLARAVARFKYEGRYVLGQGLATLLAGQAPAELLDWAELAAPVPLHPRRLMSRGFNQALVLARGLAEARGLVLAPRLLARRRHTRPQVGLKPTERAANVAGAFALGPREGHLARGRRVLLVDDVYTTGATLAECARVLLAGGAAEVAALTLTRAQCLGSHSGSGEGAVNPGLAGSR